MHDYKFYKNDEIKLINPQRLQAFIEAYDNNTSKIRISKINSLYD